MLIRNSSIVFEIQIVMMRKEKGKKEMEKESLLTVRTTIFNQVHFGLM